MILSISMPSPSPAASTSDSASERPVDLVSSQALKAKPAR